MELIPFLFYFRNKRLYQPRTTPQQLLLLLLGGNKNKVSVFAPIYLFAAECCDSNKYFYLVFVFYLPHFFTIAPPSTSSGCDHQ
jgi:hypothetical protein